MAMAGAEHPSEPAEARAQPEPPAQPILAPFRGWLVKPEWSERVISRAYDNLTLEERRSIAAANPYSYVNVTRSSEDLADGDDFSLDGFVSKGAAALSRLLKAEVFSPTGRPAVYLYRMTHDRGAQTGVICTAAVRGLSDGRIRLHENVRDAHTELLAAHLMGVGTSSNPVALTVKTGGSNDTKGGNDTGGKTGGSNDTKGGNDTGGKTGGGKHTKGGNDTGGKTGGGKHTSSDTGGGSETRGDNTKGNNTGNDTRGGEQTGSDNGGGEQTGGELTAMMDEITAASPAELVFGSSQVHHEIWTAPEESTVPLLALLDGKVLYVTDGHHRLAAAQKALAAEPHNRMLQRTLVAVYPSHEMHVEAFHRMVSDRRHSRPSESLAALAAAAEELKPVRGPLEAWPRRRGQVGIYVGGSGTWHQMRLPGAPAGSSAVGSLDVELLRRRILDPVLGTDELSERGAVEYLPEPAGITELVRRCDAENRIGFVMHPVSVGELINVADENGRMPPKSSFFTPKPRSGALLRMLGRGATAHLPPS